MSEDAATALGRCGLLDSGTLDAMGDLDEAELRETFVQATLQVEAMALDDSDHFVELVKQSKEVARSKRARLAGLEYWQMVEDFTRVHSEVASGASCSGDRLDLPATSHAVVPRWATRVQRAIATRGASPEARARIEEKERSRWLTRLVRIITEAHLPLVQIAQQTLKPEATLATAAQGRRHRTLRQRVRTFLKASDWFFAVFGLRFPATEAQVIDYMRDRADEPCGKTCLRSFVSALAFIEKGGAVAPSDRLSARAAVQEALGEWTLEVVGSKGTTRRKANPLFVAMMVSLELTVINPDVPPYKQAFAWFKLVKTWGSLRFDDTLSLSPADVVFMEGTGLECRLRRTKTSGPGKNVETLFAFVSVKCYVATSAWLKTGHVIWSKLADFERDYFLPLPSGDFHSTRRVPAEYVDASNMSRALLSELPEVKMVSDGQGPPRWESTSRHLLSRHSLLFWSEHSERSVLPTWSAVQGIPKGDRDFLGRWKATESDEYVRAAKDVVARIQDIVSEHVRASVFNRSAFGEHTLLQQLKEFLEARGAPAEHVQEQIIRFSPIEPDVEPEKTKDATGTTSSSSAQEGGRPPSSSAEQGPPADEKRVQREEGTPPVACLGTSEEEELCFGPALQGEGGTDEGHEPLAEYVVSMSNKTHKFRRLHIVGRCWRRPGVHFKHFELVYGGLEGIQYDALCRDCRKAEVEVGTTDPHSGVSDDDESSSSWSHSTEPFEP